MEVLTEVQIQKLLDEAKWQLVVYLQEGDEFEATYWAGQCAAFLMALGEEKHDAMEEAETWKEDWR